MSTDQVEETKDETDKVEAENTDTDTSEATPVDDEAVEQSPDADDSPQKPEFQDLQVEKTSSANKVEISRFHDVQVTVSAELGKTNVSIQKLLTLSEGSVFELNRSISAPVELIAQGVPFGNGEVVVIDDTFAIRIKEIYSSS